MKLFIFYLVVALTFVLATALPQYKSIDEDVFHSAEEDIFHSAENSSDEEFHSAQESIESEVFHSAEENPAVNPKLKPTPQPSN